jgi:hypothetical protein
VYVSFDDGARWQPLNHKLPVVPIHDLVVKDGDLAVATHGRSFWILDNVALLHQFDARALANDAHIFQPRPTVRYRDNADLVGRYAGNVAAGQNPPDGVVIPFYVRTPPRDDVTLRILRGTDVVRTFEKVTVRAGANRFVWDMRYPGAVVLPGAVFQGSAQGPLAPPGTYRVELQLAGRTLSQSFEIRRDPRIAYTDADLVAQWEFLMRARDELTETMRLVQKIRDMRVQAEQIVQRAGGTRQAQEALKVLNDRLYPLEERLVQYRARAGQDLIAWPTGVDSKLARLMTFASMADAPPTQGQRELLGRMTQVIQQHANAVSQVEEKEFAAIRRMARP